MIGHAVGLPVYYSRLRTPELSNKPCPQKKSSCPVPVGNKSHLEKLNRFRSRSISYKSVSLFSYRSVKLEKRYCECFVLPTKEKDTRRAFLF